MTTTPISSNAVSDVTIKKLDAPLGAQVTGVDFAKPIGRELKEVLIQAWTKHLILVFKNQRHITQEQHIEATKIFGQPVPGAVVATSKLLISSQTCYPARRNYYGQ